MIVQPGDIVFIPFPFSDLSTEKKRPVLVITILDSYGDFTELAITSRFTEQDAYEIVKEDLLKGNLPKASWIRLNKVYTLNSELVIGSFGKLKSTCYQSVKDMFCLDDIEIRGEKKMQADFLDAHERHISDADLLSLAQRWANADHLYGIAV
jgi:mRNA interferase MazF